MALRYKKKKTPDNIFLIHLTIADLGILVVTVPMNFVSCVRGTWSFGQLGCNLYGYSGGFFGFVAIMIMVCMSIERYFVIRNPFNSLKITKNLITSMVFECFVFVCGIYLKCLDYIYDEISSSSFFSYFFAKGLIYVVYIYAAIFITPELFLNEGFVLEGFFTSCSFDYLSRDSRTRSFMIIMFVGGFFVPLSIILISYVMLFVRLKFRPSYVDACHQKRGGVGVAGSDQPSNVSDHQNSIKHHDAKSTSIKQHGGDLQSRRLLLRRQSSMLNRSCSVALPVAAAVAKIAITATENDKLAMLKAAAAADHHCIDYLNVSGDTAHACSKSTAAKAASDTHDTTQSSNENRLGDSTSANTAKSDIAIQNNNNSNNMNRNSIVNGCGVRKISQVHNGSLTSTSTHGEAGSTAMLRSKSRLGLFSRHERQSYISNVMIRELKLIKYIILVILFYCIAWSPYAILTLVAQFGVNINDYVTPYTTVATAVFAKSSTIFNPLLFSLNNPRFRRFVRAKVMRRDVSIELSSKLDPVMRSNLDSAALRTRSMRLSANRCASINEPL